MKKFPKPGKRMTLVGSPESGKSHAALLAQAYSRCGYEVAIVFRDGGPSGANIDLSRLYDGYNVVTEEQDDNQG